MMPKQLRVVMTVGVAAFLLGSGASFLFAAWDNPTVPPTGGNVTAPLNVGSVFQTKAGGGIGVEGLVSAQTLNSSGTLTVVSDTKLGKDLEITGKIKKDVVVEGRVTVGQSLVAPLVSAGPLSPEGALGSVVLTAGGKVQIRGGSPTAGFVLTAEDSSGNAKWAPSLPPIGGNGTVLTAQNGAPTWQQLPPAGVTRVKAGSHISLTNNNETGEVTVNASWPDIPREVPYPEGGGKVLVSNSAGQMSWESLPTASAPSFYTLTTNGSHNTASLSYSSAPEVLRNAGNNGAKNSYSLVWCDPGDAMIAGPTDTGSGGHHSVVSLNYNGAATCAAWEDAGNNGTPRCQITCATK